MFAPALPSSLTLVADTYALQVPVVHSAKNRAERVILDSPQPSELVPSGFKFIRISGDGDTANFQLRGWGGVWIGSVGEQKLLIVAVPADELAKTDVHRALDSTEALLTLKKSGHAVWRTLRSLEDAPDCLKKTIAALEDGDISCRTALPVVVAPSDTAGARMFLPPAGRGFISIREQLEKLGSWNDKGPAKEAKEFVTLAAQVDAYDLDGLDPSAIAGKCSVPLGRVEAMLQGKPLAEMMEPGQLAKLTIDHSRSWQPTTESVGLGYIVGSLWQRWNGGAALVHHEQTAIDLFVKAAGSAGITCRVTPALSNPTDTIKWQEVHFVTPGIAAFMEAQAASADEVPRLAVKNENLRRGFVRGLVDRGFKWVEADSVLEWSGSKSACNQIKALFSLFGVYPAASPRDKVTISDLHDLAQVRDQTLVTDRYKLNRITTALNRCGRGAFSEEKYERAVALLREQPGEDAVYAVAKAVGVSVGDVRSWNDRVPERMVRRDELKRAVKRLFGPLD